MLGNDSSHLAGPQSIPQQVHVDIRDGELEDIELFLTSGRLDLLRNIRLDTQNSDQEEGFRVTRELAESVERNSSLIKGL